MQREITLFHLSNWKSRMLGECARNVLIALCEECPSADPLPILFLESEIVFEAEREKETERANRREREKVGYSYSLENWSMSF